MLTPALECLGTLLIVVVCPAALYEVQVRWVKSGCNIRHWCMLLHPGHTNRGGWLRVAEASLGCGGSVEGCDAKCSTCTRGDRASIVHKGSAVARC